MQVSSDVIDELSEKTFDPSGRSAVVGLDGFVDKIVTPVDKRHGLEDDFDAIETIGDLGARISAAAGKSANIELYPRFDKLGGNGPIMANALLSLGLGVRYVGALGRPVVDPVFEEFARSTEAVSLTNPGITTAAEFKDGKLMFGNMRSLGEIDFDRIMEVCGRESFLEMLTKADVVSIVNWTMIPKMTSILQRMAEEIMPGLGDAGPEGFFFDLTDPAKRSTEDIREVLEVISRFQGFSEVTLGLNFNEAHQVSDTLGLQKGERSEQSLRDMASAIREKLRISCVVVHPVESAACATEEGSWWSEGPYTENPKITTGAGDHFNAGFSAARLCGFSPLASLALATCTSGHYVRSAQSPTPDQVVDLLTQASESSQ